MYFTKLKWDHKTYYSVLFFCPLIKSLTQNISGLSLSFINIWLRFTCISILSLFFNFSFLAPQSNWPRWWGHQCREGRQAAGWTHPSARRPQAGQSVHTCSVSRLLQWGAAWRSHPLFCRLRKTSNTINYHLFPTYRVYIKYEGFVCEKHWIWSKLSFY